MSNFNRNGGRTPVGPSLNPPKLPEFKTDFDQPDTSSFPKIPGMELPRRPGLGTTPYKPRTTRFEGGFGAGSQQSSPIAPRPTLPQDGGSQGGGFPRPQTQTPGQTGGTNQGRQAHWQGRLNELKRSQDFVDPTNEWENDDWQQLYSTDDDVTADGGDRWMREFEQGTRAKLKDNVSPELKAVLSALDPAEYASAIREAGYNPADYLEEEPYERVAGASAIPEAWMAEVELWDPEFQQAYTQAYEQGNERASQRIRNMARAAMFERDWMPQPQQPAPAQQAQPTYSTQPVSSPVYDDIEAPAPARPTPPSPASLLPSAPWERPNRYGY